MTPSVGAVLVDYDAGDELLAGLRSIATECEGLAWEAVVVDNASPDASAASVGGMPQVRVIANRENVGFGRGVNQAVAATTAPLLLVMNPDCRLERGALAAMRAVVEADPRCALVGPKILDPDGTLQGSVRGDPDMLTGLFGRTSRLRKLMPWLSVARRNVQDDRVSVDATGSAVADWVSGACFLARREALVDVKGFDPRYFLYWEDADLCRRLRGRGWRIRYAPGAVAVHRVGHSSRTVRTAAVRAFHESAYLYYATHVAPGALNPARWLARGLLAARCWWKLRAARDGARQVCTGRSDETS